LVYKSLLFYKALWLFGLFELFSSFLYFSAVLLISLDLFLLILFGSFLYLSAVLLILLNLFLLIRDIGFNSCCVLLNRAYNLLAIWQSNIRNEPLDYSNHSFSKCSGKNGRLIFNFTKGRKFRKKITRDYIASSFFPFSFAI